MKSGELKAAIRKMRQPPEIEVTIGGVKRWVKVQKVPFMDLLTEMYPAKNLEVEAWVSGCRVSFDGEPAEDDLDHLLL